MIVTLIFNFFYLFLTGLLLLLPVGSLPSGFLTALNFFWGTVNTFSFVIPVDTMLQALVLVYGFDLVVLLWSVLQWVIRKIPGMQ